MSIDGSTEIGSFFSLSNIFKQPDWPITGPGGALDARSDMDAHPLHWELPNIVLYPLAFFGADLFLPLPLVAALGVAGLVHFSTQMDARGAVGRFGVASLLLMLAVHLPYWFQSERYLLVPATIANIAAAVLIAQWLGERGAVVASRGFMLSWFADPGGRGRPVIKLIVPAATVVLAIGVLWTTEHGMAGPRELLSAPGRGISQLHELLDRYSLE